MAGKGLFSFESAICLLLVISLVLLSSCFVHYGNSDLIKSQKIHDLLIVFAYSGCNQLEMISDADFFLGRGNYSLMFGGVELVSNGAVTFFDSVYVSCWPSRVNVVLSA